MQQNELNHFNQFYLVKIDSILLLLLLSSYNAFDLVIMNYWSYGLPYGLVFKLVGFIRKKQD